MSDLRSTEEISISDFSLGHCFDLHPATINMELQVIHETLLNSQKSLDFATLLLRSPNGQREINVGADMTCLNSAIEALDTFPQFKGSIGFHFQRNLRILQVRT